MRRIPYALAAGLALGLAGPLTAGEPLPRGAAADLGFDPEALSALDAAIQARIDAGAFPGAIVMIARDGEVAHLSTLGERTEGGEAMSEDAIFRIYSMTKPIASVAAMQLVEEGRLHLGAPVSAYLPGWDAMTVVTGVADDGGLVTEPARRAPTVQDLLRHTAGLTYGFFGSGPAREALLNSPVDYATMDNMRIAAELAKLPLEHQPGAAWEYSRATDVLGAVIEAVDGRPLGEALEARIFGPLGMDDTGFWVEDEAGRARIAEAKADDRKIGPFDMFDPRRRPSFESGGGGLVSTIHDYSRFAQMLLNGGELDGVRILSPATVEYMTADHLGSIGPGKYYLPGPGYGFGLGFGVRTSTGVAPTVGNPGEYYWGGAAGTYVVWDPEEDMFVLYMMQSPKSRVGVRHVLRNMTYGALTGADG
ncbi:MAG TPA: serine hydrolase domain-containing protein [Paracoccaceae bacterium]|nr:serine hydrolase domain-containing protein [Paracoccaceae bacterium]